MSHCRCDPDDRDPVTYDSSPDHFDGETFITECNNCWGLIR